MRQEAERENRDTEKNLQYLHSSITSLNRKKNVILKNKQSKNPHNVYL